MAVANAREFHDLMNEFGVVADRIAAMAHLRRQYLRELDAEVDFDHSVEVNLEHNTDYPDHLLGA